MAVHLEDELRAEGIECSPDLVRRLSIYCERLERWNHAMNLTALEGAELILRLIVEPLWIFGRLQPSGSYLDIGSGSGSPAIPWISTGAFEHAELVEARRKRAVFLHQTCRAIGLGDCVVHACRLSEFTGYQVVRASGSSRPDGRSAPDWITIQGVRADAELWSCINEIRGKSTRIVWLTGTDSDVPEGAAQQLSVPGSSRRALIFGGLGA